MGHHRIRGWRIIPAVIFGSIAVAGFVLGFGWLVMKLWNWLMPVLFHITAVTFWQAVGIVVLAKILFSTPKFHRGFHKHHRQMNENEGWGPDHDWRFYKDFWKEEGRSAFDAYIAKKKQEATIPK